MRIFSRRLSIQIGCIGSNIRSSRNSSSDRLPNVRSDRLESFGDIPRLGRFGRRGRLAGCRSRLACEFTGRRDCPVRRFSEAIECSFHHSVGLARRDIQWDRLDPGYLLRLFRPGYRPGYRPEYPLRLFAFRLHDLTLFVLLDHAASPRPCPASPALCLLIRQSKLRSRWLHSSDQLPRL